MFKILSALAIAVVAAGMVASPVLATTASNNHGSIVKISGSCANIGDVASNNRGSIVKIEGNGQCDINQILQSSAVQNNRGSIINISNVCGDTTGVAQNNRGSIIKIETTGPCKKDQPTTVTITPADDKQAKSTVVTAGTGGQTPTNTNTPAQLPETGAGYVAGLAIALGAGSLVYAGRFIRSKV